MPAAACTSGCIQRLPAGAEPAADSIIWPMWPRLDCSEEPWTFLASSAAAAAVKTAGRVVMLSSCQRPATAGFIFCGNDGMGGVSKATSGHVGSIVWSMQKFFKQTMRLKRIVYWSNTLELCHTLSSLHLRHFMTCRRVRITCVWVRCSQQRSLP